MGYLNNTTRVLDAILTKKGREILSSGGDFLVSKFALGDDEVDYSLWDTTHTNGTDFYGAVIDNLPALEPFNDPSEIMKYKLVTRSDGTAAMVKLNDAGTTASNLIGLKYHSTGDINRVSINHVGVTTFVGRGQSGTATIAIEKADNQLDGNLDYQAFINELYTVTLLDSSVAVLAPEAELSDGSYQINTENGPEEAPSTKDLKWVPFVDNVQHISQTVSDCAIEGNSGQLHIGNAENLKALTLYPKRVTADTHTSIIITGQSSGCVIEFPITITYTTSSEAAE
tara:strand:+ start:1337 stop:2188 length:852 start_codon:yes stop_codon:yes gene_type:complete